MADYEEYRKKLEKYASGNLPLPPSYEEARKESEEDEEYERKLEIYAATSRPPPEQVRRLSQDGRSRVAKHIMRMKESMTIAGVPEEMSEDQLYKVAVERELAGELNDEGRWAPSPAIRKPTGEVELVVASEEADTAESDSGR